MIYLFESPLPAALAPARRLRVRTLRFDIPRTRQARVELGLPTPRKRSQRLLRLIPPNFVRLQ